MASQPGETPIEDIRNAMQILVNNGVLHHDTNDKPYLTFDYDDVTAVRLRLMAAVNKLTTGRW